MIVRTMAHYSYEIVSGPTPSELLYRTILDGRYRSRQAISRSSAALQCPSTAVLVGG